MAPLAFAFTLRGLVSSSSTPVSRLLRLALPVVGLNVLGVLTLAIDTALAGRLPDAERSLSALAMASQIVVFANVVVMGFTVGAVALLARAHGAGDRERIAQVLDEATRLTLILGAVMAILGTTTARGLLGLLGADGEVARLGVSYLRPVFACSFIYYLFLLYAASLRALGHATLPLFVATATSVLHVVLAVGWMLGRFGLPRLGVAGAAYATVASQLAALAILLSALARGIVPGLSPRWPRLRADRRLVEALVRIGAPAALDLALVNLRFLALLATLAPFGPSAVAAHGIGIRIQSIAFVPGLAIAQATSALVGQALGAGRVDEARAVARGAVGLAVLVMSTLGLLVVLAAAPLAEAFHLPRGGAAHALAVQWMRILGGGMPLVGLQIALVGALRGAGATGTSFRINFAGSVLVLVPTALFSAALGLGPVGVWSSFPIALLVMAALTVAAYRRGTWAKAGVDVGEHVQGRGRPGPPDRMGP